LSEDRQRLEQTADSLGIGHYKRHVFLCTGPDCCEPDVGQQAWTALKKELKERGLTSGPGACYRTKVGCLRICTQGPTMVVYPEGAWYHGMVADRIPIFVEQHLVGNRPIQEWIFAWNPLPAAVTNDQVFRPQSPPG
jgi:(2Fe-2S) ferredoxin